MEYRCIQVNPVAGCLGAARLLVSGSAGLPRREHARALRVLGRGPRGGWDGPNGRPEGAPGPEMTGPKGMSYDPPEGLGDGAFSQ